MTTVFSDSSEVDNLGSPKRRFRAMGLFLAGAAAVAVAWMILPNKLAATRSGANHPGVGQTLSDLRLDPLTASAPLQLEQLRGQVALINFWGPWCTYCRVEFPELVDLHKRKSARKDFQFISVSCPASEGEPIAKLRAESQQMLRETGAQFECRADRNMTTVRSVVQSAKLEGFSFPTTVLIDRKGVIRAIWEGYADGDVEDMDRLVDQILAESSS